MIKVYRIEKSRNNVSVQQFDYESKDSAVTALYMEKFSSWNGQSFSDKVGAVAINGVKHDVERIPVRYMNSHDYMYHDKTTGEYFSCPSAFLLSCMSEDDTLVVSNDDGSFSMTIKFGLSKSKSERLYNTLSDILLS